MEYKIQYSKIKNIYIQIKEGKVIVKAPKRVTREEIEKILKNKEKWINKSKVSLPEHSVPGDLRIWLVCWARTAD